MNMRSWIRNVIDNPLRMAMPIMTHPGIEAIDKNIKDAVTDGYVHYMAIRRLYEDYPSAAITSIMDLTVEAEAFGCTVLFPDDEMPTVVDRIVDTSEDVAQLQTPSVHSGRIPEYLKAFQYIVSSQPDCPIFAGCIGPFSLGGRLFDMTRIMMALYIEPQTIHSLLEKCTRFITSYIESIKETGADGVIMAEPAAGLLSDKDCFDFSTVYIKKIIDKVQTDTFSIILHNCGNTGHCTNAMMKCGAHMYHFGNKIDMVNVLDSVHEDILVMGNIDPVGAFKQMRADEVYNVTFSLLRKTKKYRNFVLSSGCDIPPNVPVANIHAFYAALSDYNNDL